MSCACDMMEIKWVKDKKVIVAIFIFEKLYLTTKRILQILTSVDVYKNVRKIFRVRKIEVCIKNKVTNGPSKEKKVCKQIAVLNCQLIFCLHKNEPFLI